MNFAFFFHAFGLGIGLAMDAFSVSLANGLNEPNISKKRICLISGVFGFFQFLMPLLGWVFVHSILQYFTAFEKLIPWIALVLLVFIGIKMIFDSSNNKSSNMPIKLAFSTLIFQGIATSIDALSVGFTIAKYSLQHAIISSLIIGLITFILCVLGVIIGKKFGTKLENKAATLGGIILIIIGIEIFITGIM